MDPRPVGSEILRQMEAGGGGGGLPPGGCPGPRPLLWGGVGCPVRVSLQLVLAEQAVEDPQCALGIFVHDV